MMHEKGRYDAKHIIMMALACIIPLVILLALLIFGISGKFVTIGSIALMVILHAIMMKHNPLARDAKHKGGRA